MSTDNQFQNGNSIIFHNSGSNLRTIDHNFEYNINNEDSTFLNRTIKYSNSIQNENKIRKFNDFEIQINEKNQLLLNYDNTEENESKLKIKERKYYIDVLRIIANLMVVTVHSSSYAIYENPVFSDNWTKLMFWDAMNRACVPIFIMISGVLFLDPQNNISISKLYKKYIFRLIKIIFFWNFIYATIGKYLISRQEFTWEDFRQHFFNDIVCGKFHMWYLYMCVGFYILTPILRIVSQNQNTLNYFIVISFGFGQCVPFIVSIFNYFSPNDYITSIDDAISKLMVYLISGYITFYPLGYFLSKIKIKNKIHLTLIYILGVITLLSTYYLKISSSKANDKEIYDFSDYNSLNVSITGICLFIFFRFTGSKILKKFLCIKGFKKLLALFSDLSFGIYLIHICYFELFFYYGFHSYSFNPIFFTPIHAFLIWICSALTIYVMKKIPFIKNFV